MQSVPLNSGVQPFPLHTNNHRPPPRPGLPGPSPADIRQTAAEVRQSLASLGVHLRQDWIAHCLQQAAEGSGGGGGGGGGGGRRQQSQAQEEVYRTFLACDLREAGEACLPPGVGDMVKKRVRGKIVVQVKLQPLV